MYDNTSLSSTYMYSGLFYTCKGNAMHITYST